MIPRRSRLECGALVAGIVLLLALFADKPLHIDDPLTVWTAKHLHEAPLDFYGFSAHWYNARQPMSQITQNPPGAAYLLAIGALAFGWSELALHAVMLLAAALGVACTYGLAARLCGQPGLATLAAWSTPALFVSATTLMSDVPMIALYCATLLVWLRAVEARSWTQVAAAGLLGAACALTKYFGASVFALMALHAWLRRDGLGWRTAALLPGLLLLGAYEAWSLQQYGSGLLSGAGRYASEHRGAVGPGLLVYAGGAVATLVFFVPRLLCAAGARALAGLAAIVVVLCVAVASSASSLPDLGGAALFAWWLHVAVAALAAACVLGLLADECFSQRSDASWLLIAWVVGTLVFAGFVNWTLAARSIAPLAPPLAILLVRALERRGLVMWVPEVAAAAAFALAVTLIVAGGDRSLARSGQKAAVLLSEKYGEETIFLGNWGFQYYMQELGGRPYDYLQPAPFERAIVPSNNSGELPWAQDRLRVEGSLLVENEGWASTMRGGAGFYTDRWGALPFVLGAPAPERYDIVVVDGGPP